MSLRIVVFFLVILLMGAAVEDRDYKVIEALKSNGSDVSKPHEIDFFLDFDKLEQAAPIAQVIDNDGFEVKVYENEDGTFTIEAKKTLVPSLSVMRGISEKLNALTLQYGGNYDGWGAEVVE